MGLLDYFLPSRTSAGTLDAHKELLTRALQASYDAAQGKRRLAGWRPSSAGPVQRVASSLPAVRQRSRDLARNNLVSRAAIDRWVSTLVGSGISPKPLVDDAVMRKKLITLWEDWAECCDFDGQTDYYGLQTLVTRSMLEGAEALIKLVPRKTRSGISLQLQVLEGEHLSHKNTPAPNGNRVIDGIELNAVGQRVAYWLYPQHPGDWLMRHHVSMEPVRVPASQIVHVFEAQSPGQLRGMPLQAPGMVKLKGLDEFDDATLERQKLANLFMAFITRPPADAEAASAQLDLLLQAIKQLQPGQEQMAADMVAVWRNQTQAGGMVGLEPGIAQELLPGESVEFSNPPGVGSDYDPFTRQQHHQIAAGFGVPYAVMMYDFTAENDRTVRVSLNEFRRHAQQRQRNVLIPTLCRAVREAWFDAAVLAGLIPSDPALRATRWTPQGFAYIHPVQDVEASVRAIANGLTSRSEALLERGLDADLVDEEVAQDNEREHRLGLKFAYHNQSQIAPQAGDANKSQTDDNS